MWCAAAEGDLDPILHLPRLGDRHTPGGYAVQIEAAEARGDLLWANILRALKLPGDADGAAVEAALQGG